MISQSSLMFMLVSAAMALCLQKMISAYSEHTTSNPDIMLKLVEVSTQPCVMPYFPSKPEGVTPSMLSTISCGLDSVGLVPRVSGHSPLVILNTGYLNTV